MDDGRARDLRAPVPFFNIDEVDDQRLAHRVYCCNATKLTVKSFSSPSPPRSTNLPTGRHRARPHTHSERWRRDRGKQKEKCHSKAYTESCVHAEEMVPLTSSSGRNGCKADSFLSYRAIQLEGEGPTLRLPRELLCSPTSPTFLDTQWFAAQLRGVLAQRFFFLPLFLHLKCPGTQNKQDHDTWENQSGARE